MGRRSGWRSNRGPYGTGAAASDCTKAGWPRSTRLRDRRSEARSVCYLLPTQIVDSKKYYKGLTDLVPEDDPKEPPKGPFLG